MTDEEKKAIKEELQDFIEKYEPYVFYSKQRGETAEINPYIKKYENHKKILTLIEKQENKLENIESRLKHLFCSKIIREYDKVNSKTHKYELDIEEFDLIHINVLNENLVPGKSYSSEEVSKWDKTFLRKKFLDLQKTKNKLVLFLMRIRNIADFSLKMYKKQKENYKYKEKLKEIIDIYDTSEKEIAKLPNGKDFCLSDSAKLVEYFRELLKGEKQI